MIRYDIWYLPGIWYLVSDKADWHVALPHSLFAAAAAALFPLIALFVKLSLSKEIPRYCISTAGSNP